MSNSLRRATDAYEASLYRGMMEEDRKYHEAYENADDRLKFAVDDAYDAARKAIEARGFSLSNSDPAEAFLAMIMRYIIVSRHEELDGKYLST